VPANVVAFNDDVLEQTKFDTTRWVDKVTDYCGADFCGTMSYHFTLVNGDPLPFQHTASMVGDDLVLKVQTTDTADIGTYQVRVNAVWTLIDSSIADTKFWDSFEVQIKSICEDLIYCEATTLLAPGNSPSEIPLDITATIGGDAVSSGVDEFRSQHGVDCNVDCGTVNYYLVYAADNKNVSTDLARLSLSGTGQVVVTVSTSDQAFLGTHDVKILGESMYTKLPQV